MKTSDVKLTMNSSPTSLGGSVIAIQDKNALSKAAMDTHRRPIFRFLIIIEKKKLVRLVTKI
ncbi:MAG: hypothetical protein QMD23_00100 [Candidatus Bathyarchaeia archaeon]|nr:hypothetical protein [Candidatus Bathyarchaeia archaeon]